MIRSRASLGAAFVAISLAFAVPTLAQDRVGRFQMSPVEGGVLRLDTMTGALSHCAATTGKWSCTSAEDDMRTLYGELDRLIGENRKLQADIAQLRSGSPPADTTRPGVALTLPSEADIDKTLDALDRWARKLHDRFRSEKLRDPAGPL